MGKVVRIKDRQADKIPYSLIVLALILVCLIGFFLVSINKKRVTVYEVNSGKITDNSTYTGFVIRHEELVRSDYSGNINYFVYENERVANGENICLIDNSGTITSYINSLKDNKTSLRTDDINKLNYSVADFKNNFNTADYSLVYDFKNNINTSIETYLNDTILDDLNSYIEVNTSGYNLMSAGKTGVIMYGYDNYETFDPETLGYDDFKKDEYSYTSLIGRTKISSNDIAYRIVTEQEWNIYIKLPTSDSERLKNVKTVNITFTDSDISTPADFEIYTNSYGVYGKLTLNRYVNRYASQRFVSIDLSSSYVEGLKIPKTSIVKKKFYKIPTSFIKKGNNSSTEGIMVLRKDSVTKEEKATLCAVDVYASDDAYSYIDISVLQDDDKIIDDSSGSFYELVDYIELPGVYCVNKGYTVFKPVEILDENDDFYIVDDNTKYGLSAYDHILYDGSQLSENEIIY